MPGRMITPLKVVDTVLTQAAKNKTEVLLDVLCNVGEQCIIEARENGDYTDRTGNLRSSIGYAVLLDGKVIQQGQANKVRNGDKGLSEGLSYLKARIAKASKKGVVLIVTAGMNYAEYVETKRIVLSSAELKAPQIAKQLLTRLGFKVK